MPSAQRRRGERATGLDPVDALDDVEEGRNGLRLVGLEVSDKVLAHRRQQRELCAGFLEIVLADVGEAVADGGRHDRSALAFGHSHDGHHAGVAAAGTELVVDLA